MWGAILGVLGFVWQGVQAGIDAIVVALQWAAGALKTGLLGAWQAVRFTWSDIIKPVGQWLAAAYDRLKALYTTVIKPALDWLKRVTDAIKRVYNTLLKPILSTIDNVRKVLQLLELLHVGFAAKLDAELADLERKLSLPLQLVIQEFNKLTNRVESYVLTIENLFTRVTHLGSIGRDLKAIQNMHWGAWSASLGAALTGTPPAPATLAPTSDHAAVFDAVIAGDDAGAGFSVGAALDLFDTVTAAP